MMLSCGLSFFLACRSTPPQRFLPSNSSRSSPICFPIYFSFTPVMCLSHSFLQFIFPFISLVGM